MTETKRPKEWKGPTETRQWLLIIPEPKDGKYIIITTPGYPEHTTGWIGETTQMQILLWLKTNNPKLWEKVARGDFI
jgi:hypothetical protein